MTVRAIVAIVDPSYYRWKVLCVIYEEFYIAFPSVYCKKTRFDTTQSFLPVVFYVLII